MGVSELGQRARCLSAKECGCCNTLSVAVMADRQCLCKVREVIEREHKGGSEGRGEKGLGVGSNGMVVI